METIPTTAPSRQARARPGRDKKRYLWLIGLVVPSLAFVAFGMWAATGWGVWFWVGPIVVLGVVPAIDLFAGLDRSNPPGRRHRGAREGPLLPVDHLPLPAHPVRRLRRGPLRHRQRRAVRPGRARPRRTRSASRSPSAPSAASASTPPTSSATSARPTSAGSPRSPWRRASTATSTSSTTAATTCAWPPPRTPRRRRLGRDVLRLLAAHRPGLAEERLAPGEEALRPQGPAPVPPRQRRAQRLGDVGGALRWPHRLARRRDRARSCCCRRSSASRCSRSSTTWSTTGCCARRSASAARSATSASTRPTPGTPTTSPPTCCSTTCSATATTTPTRPVATRRCATSRSHRCCPPATPG